MVIIKLMGGLGNQMFQFAFGVNYIKKQIPVKFDTSYFNHDSRHGGYQLERVFENITIDRAVKRDIFYFLEKVKTADGDFSYQLKENRHFVDTVNGGEFSYHPDLLEIDNAYLIGYWQNEQYLNDNRNTLKKYFKFKPISATGLKETADLITATNAVSIHVRRGDYLQSAAHVTLDSRYFREAIQYMRHKIADPYFFVFSDDINWAKEHLQADHIHFVENNNIEHSYIDMQLMSYCKHNIIANSTFSWWAAWLNENPGKTVISPALWFNIQENAAGLTLKNWVTL